MRLLALLLVPAFIGMVVSQRQGMYDQANFKPGGASGNRGSRYRPGFDNTGQGQNYGNGQGQNYGNVHHANVGAGPPPGSSRQVIPDLAPVRPGPMQGNVHHSNIGNGPAPGETGGGSHGVDVALGPVQTGTVDRVNMVNRGGAPLGGNQNSNERYGYDHGNGRQAGNGGGANNHPNPQGGAGGQNVYNNFGGDSGNGGPAYAAGPYSDNAGQGAPLGGAAMNEFNQKDSAASTGAASVGSTVAGVVCAVLVLVGIVTVAAVFIVRQRKSRMSIASV